MPFRGISSCDLAKVCVSSTTVRRGITGYIEKVEEVRSEIDVMFTEQVEGLEDRRIDLFIAWGPQRARTNVAETVVWLLSEDAGSVVLIWTTGSALNCRTIVRVQGTIHNLQRTKLVRPGSACERVYQAGVVCRRTDCKRKTAVGHIGAAQLPTTYPGVQNSIPA